MSRKRRLVVSLFCGAGGLDLGFDGVGDFEVAVAIDNDPKVLSIYRKNFPNTITLRRDIEHVTSAEIHDYIRAKYKDWDGTIAAVIGGPPCQGFSIGGLQNVDDVRSLLVIRFISLVVELNPTLFVMENVPAIEWKKYSHITGNVKARIEEHYNLSKWLLDATDYGVPQKRSRAIWVGSNRHNFLPPPLSDKKYTVFDALADLSDIPIAPQIDSWILSKPSDYASQLCDKFPCRWVASNQIDGCRSTVHTVVTQQKYAVTVPGGKEPTTWARRLSGDGFCPTLRAGSGNRTAARPIHYEHARVITVREAARLHSFPDWFSFGESKLAAHKAIGNSVPPLLARAIASHLWKEQYHLPCPY
jgi:DNA (cytosine-5)-methyltransferase 1